MAIFPPLGRNKATDGRGAEIKRDTFLMSLFGQLDPARPEANTTPR